MGIIASSLLLDLLVVHIMAPGIATASCHRHKMTVEKVCRMANDIPNCLLNVGFRLTQNRPNIMHANFFKVTDDNCRPAT